MCIRLHKIYQKHITWTHCTTKHIVFVVIYCLKFDIIDCRLLDVESEEKRRNENTETNPIFKYTLDISDNMLLDNY